MAGTAPEIQRAGMTVVDLLTEPGWLDPVLGFETSADVVKIERIGEQIGFSGLIYRFELADDGFLGPTIIAKLERSTVIAGRSMRTKRSTSSRLAPLKPPIQGPI